MDVSPSALKHLIMKDFFLSRQTRKNETGGEEGGGHGWVSGGGRRVDYHNDQPESDNDSAPVTLT